MLPPGPARRYGPGRPARGWLVCVGLVALLVLGAPAVALSPDRVFVVGPVQVDVTARSSLAAREQALDQGHRAAWRRLVDRLVLPDDAEALAGLERESVNALVRDYEILRERTSHVRYLADLSFGFRPDAVRDLLHRMEIPFAETPSLPVLVVPVLVDSGRDILWEDPNPWRETWQDLSPPDGLLPVLTPWGDLVDIRDLAVEQALEGMWPPMRALARRYGAGDVVVARAHAAPEGTGARVEVALTRYGAGLESPVRSAPVTVLGDPGGLFREAADKAIAVLTDEWKRANLVQSGARSTLTVLVPIEESFRRWLRIRQRLAAIGIVRNSVIRRLSKRMALLELAVAGDAEQLRNALRQQELELHEGRDWPVLAERAQTVPEAYLPPPEPGPAPAPAGAGAPVPRS